MKHFVKIRPVTLDDLDDLLIITQNIGFGVTHLPAEKNLLTEKIERSINSFAKTIETPQDELYFFVMEDTTTQRVIGCCGIISAIDIKYPFYNYKIIQHIHSSETLNIINKNKFLQVTNDYQGFSEMGMIALLPEYQHRHVGKFLSRVRFLFLADNLNRVTSKIITQIRGLVDEQGHSIFWRSLGKKFIDLPFIAADRLIAMGEEHFIAELLPDFPILIDLLPDDIRPHIGTTHPNSTPAMALLKNEGFSYENYINIFDGGPFLELYLKNNPTIHQAKSVKVIKIEPDIESEPYMIATYNPHFCAAHGELLLLSDNEAMISEQAALILNLHLGDTVRISL